MASPFIIVHVSMGAALAHCPTVPLPHRPTAASPRRHRPGVELPLHPTASLAHMTVPVTNNVRSLPHARVEEELSVGACHSCNPPLAGAAGSPGAPAPPRWPRMASPSSS